MKHFILLSLLLILPLVACSDEVVNQSEDQVIIVTADGEKHVFNVELALTTEEQAQGLMFREKMAKNAGMLFYFEGEPQEIRFWMKNTLIPLDMIFIKGDGTIHHIHENAVPHDLTPVGSFGNVKAVLEINGGVSAEFGLFPGDQVKHPFFQKNK